MERKLALLFHNLIMRLPRLNGDHPFVRRSALIYDGVVLPKSCIVGERVKIKGLPGRFAVFGENVLVNDDTVILGNVKIGNCVRINHKCFIQDCNHDEEDLPCFDHEPKNLDSTTGPVVIEAHATIDTHAMVCKGVRIGRGAIVMAGAVVFEDVPPNAVVRGNPAVVVGFRKNALLKVD